MFPQALGGAISSREFVDLREFEISETGFINFSASVDIKISPSKGRVLGRNFPGGIVAKSVGNDLHCTMIWHAAVNGWLPASIVSKAMPGQILSTIKALREHLVKN